MALLANSRARHDYEILETLEAGIELRGFEVKALRARRGSLAGARVIVRGGEAYLVGASIPPYQPGNAPAEYDPARPRRLLLAKREIARLASAESAKGLTVVPISLYNKRRVLKLEVAIARGKKKGDKREILKRRDARREIERTLKARR